MFTGLVADVGTVRAVTKSAQGATLTIQTHFDTSELVLGESIAVDGACLTVTHILEDAFLVDASLETLDKSTIGMRRVGDRVHLERALAVGDRLGGHFVLGHVDGMGTIRRMDKAGNAWQIDVQAPEAVSMYLIDKGSVTVDGVSLTVNWVRGDLFGLTIIPYTASDTNLIDYKVGQKVNLEADVLGKYVRQLMTKRTEAPTSSITMETLMKAGFE